MPELNNIEIINGDPYGPCPHLRAGHVFKSTQGFLNTTQFYNNQVYEMDDCIIHVPYRRQRYAKELLKLASVHARLLGAKTISASNIVNRASIDALASVFGEESLSVETLGDYAPEGHDWNLGAPTKASMFYEIPKTAIESDEYIPIVMKSLQTINPEVRLLNNQLLVVAGNMRELEQKVDGRLYRLSEEDIQVYEAFCGLASDLEEERDRIRVENKASA